MLDKVELKGVCFRRVMLVKQGLTLDGKCLLERDGLVGGKMLTMLIVRSAETDGISVSI